MIVKKLIPLRVKKILFYLFKYPERTEIGILNSWFLELKSRIIIIFYPSLQGKITICTGIYNRSDNYINSVLESVVNMKKNDQIVLSIFDCGSSDFIGLKNEISSKWKGELIIESQDIPFTRSSSFNNAVEQSKTKLIFICDADIYLPNNFVEQYRKYCHQNTAWFPIVFALNKNSTPKKNNLNGIWFEDGKGMFGCTKSNFNKIGKFNTSFKNWGGEDWDIWSRFLKHKIYPIRSKSKGMYHLWHEGHKSPVNKLPND